MNCLKIIYVLPLNSHFSCTYSPYIYIYIYVFINIYICVNCMYINLFFYSQSSKIYRIDKNCLKSLDIPSQRRFVHNILVAPKCTVPKWGWIPWNDRIISGKEVQINQRAVVTKHFELGFRCSTKMKSVKPRHTGDNNPTYKIYLRKTSVQVTKMNNVNIYIYIYNNRVI